MKNAVHPNETLQSNVLHHYYQNHCGSEHTNSIIVSSSHEQVSHKTLESAQPGNALWSEPSHHTCDWGHEILPVPMSQGPYMDMDMEGHGYNKYQFTHLKN